MKIIFQHPPTGTKDPFKDFEPWNPRHYPEGGGVYIYGLKLKIDNVLKFVPIYVGKHNTNLGKRIFEHYYQERMPGNSCKEIFDLTKIKSLSDIKEIYDAMREYDSERGKSSKKISNEKLIWFNDKDFFNTYISKSLGKYKYVSLSNYISGSGHLASLYPKVGDFDLMISKDKTIAECIRELNDKIVASKSLYNDKFYFLFANNIPKDKLLFYENSTKLALQKLGIYTTAWANKEGNSSIINFELKGAYVPIYTCFV
jgi:hypothetical protein